MKINKGRPCKNLGLVLYKSYPSRHIALMEAKDLENNGDKPYIRKKGKIGDKLPYEVWRRGRKFA